MSNAIKNEVLNKDFNSKLFNNETRNLKSILSMQEL